jgi:5'-3' exonuclease
MGIKDYHKWMRENYPSAFQSQWLDSYDNIYIDINYALHYSHFGAKTENEIVGKLIWFLESIIFTLFPTRSITIANDGPAPLAKLLLQRERRASCSRSMQNLETSSLIFTPGTKFMNSIKEKLQAYTDKIEKIYRINIDFKIGCEGEAELKLKKQISENIDKYPSDTHIIVSNDADIIAMFGTLNENSFNNVFICTNVGVGKHNTEIISYGTLMNLHLKKCGKTKNYGLDFTLLSIMMGNDYLPKILCLDLDKLIASYKYCCRDTRGLVLDDKLTLNIDFLTKLINGILCRTKSHHVVISFDSYNPSLYSNYMDGLLWCLDMYNRGQCVRYNYMYENDEKPHPLTLLLHIAIDPSICNINNSTFPSIDKNIYAVLVMPKCALSLIDSKYHSFAQKCDILYEKELCEKCNDFYDKLAKLDSKSAEYTEIKKKLKIHEVSHNRIIADDILNLLSLF